VSVLKMRSKLKGEQGFTLIELVVVMAVLALLAGLVVPRFANILADSGERVDQANIEMLNNACDLYETNEGETVTDLNQLVEGNYVREIPNKPGTEEPYTLADLGRGEPGGP
jgi:general secretion pathway protein G